MRTSVDPIGEEFLNSLLSIDAWLERVKRPINLPVRPTTELASPRPTRALAKPAIALTRDGNPEGPLFGEVLVFTGALSMPRHEAADEASAAGCEVASSVSKHTTLLVVGDQDIRKLAGYEMSSKHRKAEELIAQGQKIRIIAESDFKRITDLANG